MRTLNGFLLEDLADLLDQPLHSSAYKAIASATYLTDISIVWQRRVFNKIFGMYSIGWGLDVNPDHLVVTDGEKTSKGNSTVEATLRGMFWFKYIDKNGEMKKSEFLVTGAHKDSSNNPAYAMKGAFTNALGFGGSCLGWQESVYMGERSHKNPKGSAFGRRIFKDLQEIMALKCDDNLPEKKVEKATTPDDKVVDKPVKFYVCTTCAAVHTSSEVISECGNCKVINGISKFSNKNDAIAFSENVAKMNEESKAKKEPEGKMADHYFNCSKCAGIAKVKSNAKTVIQNCPDCNIEMIKAKDEQQCIERQNQIKKEAADKAVQDADGMKYPVCLECGWTEPVNTVPPACPECGDVSKFSFQANIEDAKKMSASLQKKETQDRELLEEAKALAKGNRGYLLQVVSDCEGKKVTSYAGASNAGLLKAIEVLKNDLPENNETKEEPEDHKAELAKISKTDKVRQIFTASVNCLGGVQQVLAKISARVGRKIGSSNQLNEDELNGIYLDWVMKGDLK